MIEHSVLIHGAWHGGLGTFDLIEIGGGHELLVVQPEAVAAALVQAVAAG